MSVIVRTGAIAAAALLALTACSSQASDESASSAEPSTKAVEPSTQASSVCQGIENYQATLNQALGAIDPDIDKASKKKQDKAREELVKVMVKETQAFAQTIPESAPENIQPAIDVLIEGMKKDTPDNPEVVAANEALTNYITQECPGLFPEAGAGGSGTPADGGSSPAQ